jgi:multidrug efflux pump subunit AcrA (membrane-fusion protein)
MKLFDPLIYNVISCILLSGAIANASSNAYEPIILDETGVANLRMQTVEVEERDFETTIFAIGRIEEIPSRHSVISSRVAGRVLDLNVFKGDTVAVGDVVATIETRQIGNPPPQVQLRAPQGGLVIDSHIRPGQPVQPDTELMDISDRSYMWAVAKIPENAASQIQVGSHAYIKVPAVGSSVLEAKLVRFGVNADRRAGAVEGIFLIENAALKLLPGMRAEFSIVLEKRASVLAVPRSAIQGDPANRVVFVKDLSQPHAFIRTPVVVGALNNRFAEIVSGVHADDEVVTQGSYALGFVGSGQSISLKEALDAAHGHEHNDDGSEITDADGANHDEDHDEPAHDGHDNHQDHDDHAHDEAALNRLLLIYAGVLTLLFMIVFQRLWSLRRSQAS